MSKLKITEKQYNEILLREQESRLKASNDVIVENLTSSTELLEEGWKEVVLGISMMLGVGLTGQNKAMAQDAVKNETTMAQIKATLEDENKLGELVDALKTKGMKDPETKLADNAEKVMDAYNRIAANDDIKYKVDVKVVGNLQSLKTKLGQGYAIKKTDISTDTTVGQPQSVKVTITDTLEVNLGSDNLFVSGGFTLSSAGMDTIKVSIDEIQKQGGKIQSVDIESSTDAEQIRKFITEDDPTGNIKLANLRTQSISNELNKVGISVNITHREIPNNGSDVVSTQQFKEASTNPKTIASLREKTSDYRYVKLKIVATFETDTILTKDPVLNIIKTYRVELVKVIEAVGKTHKIKSKTTFKHKKFKCKKKKSLKSIVDACATF